MYRSDFDTRLNDLFEELLVHQNKKVLNTARDILPHLTAEDILNPHDFPELLQNPIFNYEEGIAAGLLAAQIAVRARILKPETDRGSPSV
ncbi:MAG: hypothetical protein HYX41_04945 [Bdellovibrio sp.]|nr:hypothetical protein [Bdellovibrio sp.]